MGDQNPCNICPLIGNCPDSCILNTQYLSLTYCRVYDCMLNYEGSCNLGIAEKCGCRAAADGEHLDGDNDYDDDDDEEDE